MNTSRHDAFLQRARTHPQCAECVCRVGSPEVYTVTRYRDNAVLAFDIELAHQFCQDGRAPVELPLALLHSILEVNGVSAEHIDHVDTSFPGIACPIDRTSEGEPLLGLIDGSHRAAKCAREGRPFFVFHLTAQEAQQCQETDAARACGFLEAVLRTAATRASVKEPVA